MSQCFVVVFAQAVTVEVIVFAMLLDAECHNASNTENEFRLNQSRLWLHLLSS